MQSRDFSALPQFKENDTHTPQLCLLKLEAFPMKKLCSASPTNATQPVLNRASFPATIGIDLTLSPDKIHKNRLGGKLHLKDSDRKAQHGED